MTVAKVSLLSLLVLPGCAAKPAPVERLTNPVSSTPGAPSETPRQSVASSRPTQPPAVVRVVAAGHTKAHSYHQRHWDACPPASSNESLGREMAFKAGFGEHWCDLRQLWREESGWNHRVYNRQGSGAYGIPQAKPGSKMRSAGSDWKTNPATQIRWGLRYISERYSTPTRALASKHRRGWY